MHRHFSFLIKQVASDYQGAGNCCNQALALKIPNSLPEDTACIAQAFCRSSIPAA